MDSDDSIPVMDLANQEYQVSLLTSVCVSLLWESMCTFQHAVYCVKGIKTNVVSMVNWMQAHAHFK